MTLREFSRFVPRLPSTADVLQAHQLTYDFHREVELRQEHEQYCQWYQMTAKRHRQELRRMQTDINLLAWFYRGRR